MAGAMDEDFCVTMDLLAQWLHAVYGPRLAAISLSLEGHYGPVSECYGVVPILVTRGVGVDGASETRETLPTAEIIARSEELFSRLHPHVQFTHSNSRDVRHIASSRSVASSDVSAHRRMQLLTRFGRPGVDDD